jgi:hypothetical protein
MTMNTIADPTSATVVLRGIAVNIDSDVGQAFVTDCVRHIEGLISAEALRAKYGIDDDAWQQLATNEPLQRAIAATKTCRIHDGSGVREKAAHLFVSCPDVLDSIAQDATTPARNRIDAIRELRQVAAAGSEASTPAGDRERFIININFGAQKVHREIDLKPSAPTGDGEELPPLKLIEPRDEEDEYEPPEADFDPFSRHRSETESHREPDRGETAAPVAAGTAEAAGITPKIKAETGENSPAGAKPVKGKPSAT